MKLEYPLPDSFKLSPEEMQRMKKYGVDLIKAIKLYPWLPMPNSPQMDATQSPADITIFGGSAGSSKSDWLIGMAMTQHRNSIIYRHEATQLQAIKDRIAELVGNRDGYDSKANRWTLPDGRVINFGSVPNPGDEARFQGRAFDLIAFDELAGGGFSEYQFRFLTGWNRTTIRGQRCRIIAATNPPTNAGGAWVRQFLAPWVDENHVNPAKPGELRYFAMIDGVEQEVEGHSFKHKGEVIRPVSSTFIPSKLSANPYLERTGYLQRVQALPEPLRSILLDGNFSAMGDDEPEQVIPTDWIKAAQARWKPDGHNGREMSAMGVDVARGGDATVLQARHGWWFAEPVKLRGADTETGPAVAQNILKILKGQVPAVGVDAIGVGTSVIDHLGPWLGHNLVPIVGHNSPPEKSDVSGTMNFVNWRAWSYWKLRNLLDPSSGVKVALPQGAEVLSDLTAARYTVTSRGIQIMKKEEIRKQLGRSPDVGDAIVYAAALSAVRTKGNAHKHKVIRAGDRFRP